MRSRKLPFEQKQFQIHFLKIIFAFFQPEFWWESVQAIQINGTDGTLMPPYIEKDERISVFVAELCR